MIRKEFSVTLNALDSVSELKGVKFAFAVLKNRKKLEAQIEEDKDIFERILEPSEEYKEYEEKRIELCVLYSEKDEEGNAIIEDNKYKILDIDKFNNDLNDLTQYYQEYVDSRKEQIEEYNTLMEEDITIEFQKVDIDNLPEDLSETQLRSIEFMINMD
jgi:hypothetical protein